MATEPPDVDPAFLEKFSDLDILLTSDTHSFPYASGAVGPYYIDLRRAPNSPDIFKQIVVKYDEVVSREESKWEHEVFVGVPTTGVIYATALAYWRVQSLCVMEKLNPSRFHTLNCDGLRKLLRFIRVSGQGVWKEKTIFLGLEDMGVVFATLAALTYRAPCGIMRRVQKGHGTSKTVEADIPRLVEGLKGTPDSKVSLVVFNDAFHPMTEADVLTTLHSIKGIPWEALETKVVSTQEAFKEAAACHSTMSAGARYIEIEDLWTTGSSAITLNQNIKKYLKVDASCIVFLDRDQGAQGKFDRLEVRASSAFTIGDISGYLLRKGKITDTTHSLIDSYKAPFHMASFLERLVEVNDTSVCVGLDVTAAKLPEKPEDTTLPHFPYEATDKGVVAYTMDLLEDLHLDPRIKVFKPNMAYYNRVGGDPLLQASLLEMRQRIQAKGGLVILDAKVGDIGRTMAQYADKYSDFDALTACAYMGEDAVRPIIDARRKAGGALGAFVLVFTSNPSRVDLETMPVITEEYIKALEASTAVLTPVEMARAAPRAYEVMAHKVAAWSRLGPVGAVVGGTPNAEGRLSELERCVEIWMECMGALPPILIPGVGTQGGSATNVVEAIAGVLKSQGLVEAEIRKEFRKVLINSSSAIDYSPRPREAAGLLIDEVAAALDAFFSA